MKKRDVLRTKFVSELIFLGGVILLWQMLYVIGVDVLSIWKPYAMPSPTGVVKSLCLLLADASLVKAVGYSVLRGVSGYMISVVLGCFLGFLMNHFDYLHRNLACRRFPVCAGFRFLFSGLD